MQQEASTRRRYIRLGDVMAVLAVAIVAAVVIWRPSSAAPTPRPTDTFNHVDVTLDAKGLTVQPATVPAGQVEFAFHDASGSSRPAKVVLLTQPSAFELSATEQRVAALRMMRVYTITADSGTSSRAAQLTVTEPALRAPREDAHVVTLELGRDGITAVHRDARREEPVNDGSELTKIGESRPWTSVSSGPATVVIVNRTAADGQCAVADAAGAPVSVPHGRSARLTAVIVDGSTVTIQCTSAGGTPATEFDLRGVR